MAALHPTCIWLMSEVRVGADTAAGPRSDGAVFMAVVDGVDGSMMVQNRWIIWQWGAGEERVVYDEEGEN